MSNLRSTEREIYSKDLEYFELEKRKASLSERFFSVKESEENRKLQPKLNQKAIYLTENNTSTAKKLILKHEKL